MKTCWICFYSRIFLLIVLLLAIIVILNEDLLRFFEGLEPLGISICFISVLALTAISKKFLEYFFQRKKN